MNTPRQGSVARVAAAARTVGLAIDIMTLSQMTRTAEQAAQACACSSGQIVKSLVFARADTHELMLMLVAGDRRLDLEVTGARLGVSLVRADARRVREGTGFAIGGVAPIGHLSPLPVYMDPSLLMHDRVWAAAGAPDTIFAVEPSRLREVVGAHLLPGDCCPIAQAGPAIPDHPSKRALDDRD